MKTTIKEKIGQLFFVGIQGTSLSPNTKKFLQEIQPGGIIIFEENIVSKKQLQKLIKDINHILKIKPFIGVDQEGGSVERLRKICTSFPSVWGSAKLGLKELLEVNGLISSELIELGFNLNFAPVLDINTNKKNPVIGTRAISNKKEIVTNYGSKLINFYLKNGIVPVAKHFPGHGDLDIDSHLSMPVLNKTKSELLNFELIPFKNAIKNNVPFIMISHIQVPKLENDKYRTASISKTIINSLLKDELGFKGIVITDDLGMKGITQNLSSEDACYEAIISGVDMALFNYKEDITLQAFKHINKEADNNNIPKGRIEDSFNKIIKYKKKLIYKAPPKINTLKNKSISQSITDKIVHWIKKDILFKGINPDKPFEIIYPITPKIRKDDLSLIAKKLNLKKANFVNYPLNPSYKEIEKIVKGTIKYDQHILITYDIYSRIRQKNLVDNLFKVNPSLVIISVGTEYDIELIPQITNHLAAYAPSYISLLCAFKKLLKTS